MQKITERLTAAASMVRRGARLCDVGTDHAYLPIFLYKAGRIERALASDINEGPCERARANVALHGCGDGIEVVCAAGLDAAADFAPTDVVIAGMGGEMIRDIINDSPLTRETGVRLILQPMTKAPALRDALTSQGFTIVDEALAHEDRIYQIICVEFTGRVTRHTDVELLLGPVNIARGGEVFREFAAQNLARQKKIIEAKRLGGMSAVRETALAAAIREVLAAQSAGSEEK